MKVRGRDRLYNFIVSACAIACMWLVWVIAWAAADDGYVIPSFWDTFSKMFSLFASARFWQAFGMTLARTALSWAVSLAAAAAAAWACAASVKLRRFFAPFVAVFRTVPTMAITLMLLIWSSPRVAPSIVAFLMVFPAAYAQFMAALDGIDGGLVQMAKVYRVPLYKRLFKIYVPQALPPVLSQLGPDFSLTLKVIVSAEVMCSTFNSLGGLIYQSNVFLDTAQMFALTICTLAVGGLCEWALSKLVLLTKKWRGEERGAQNDNI